MSDVTSEGVVVPLTRSVGTALIHLIKSYFILQHSKSTSCVSVPSQERSQEQQHTTTYCYTNKHKFRPLFVVTEHVTRHILFWRRYSHYTESSYREIQTLQEWESINTAFPLFTLSRSDTLFGLVRRRSQANVWCLRPMIRQPLLVALSNKIFLSGFAAPKGISLKLLLSITRFHTSQDTGDGHLPELRFRECFRFPGSSWKTFGKEFTKMLNTFEGVKGASFPLGKGERKNERSNTPSVVQSLVIGL